MKFTKRVLPPSMGPLELLLFVFACAGSILLLFAIASTFIPGVQLALPRFDPAVTARPLSTNMGTPGPVVTQAPSPTNTLVVRSPTPAPPGATPTWFYVVPANPTPIPTPLLPPAAPFPTSCDGPGRMNILLVGIDGFNDTYQRAARADAIVVVGVNFASKSAGMLSVARDLWVQLPGIPEQPESKLNAAYHFGEYYAVPGGGPAELSTTLANTLGLRIDRYVVVNFLAFEQGIDAIGGIDIDVPHPIHDPAYPLRDGSGTLVIDFPQGWVHMDGSTALIYARTRHGDTDWERMRRQQQVLFAARDKLLSPETLPQLPAVAQALVGSARTDLTLADIALLGCLGPQIRREAIQSWVIDDTVATATRVNGAYVLVPDMDALLPILESFNAGD